MTNIAAPSAPVRRITLRPLITLIHVSILLLMTAAFIVNTLLGALAGTGLYPFLATNHLAAGGLFQAYALMAVICISVWIGYLTTSPFPRAWHWVAIGAHVVPPAGLALFAATTPEMTPPVIAASLIIHAVGIGAELFALTRRG